MQVSEILIGVAEIATALAGFTGVVVVFGSRSQGTWHPGDRLRMAFMLEASLTAGGFALFALVLSATALTTAHVWAISSAAWAAFMFVSLYISHLRVKENVLTHGDVDNVANSLVTSVFVLLMLLQIANVVYWNDFAPLLAALAANLAGAAMQFTRLIRSAFHD